MPRQKLITKAILQQLRKNDAYIAEKQKTHPASLGDEGKLKPILKLFGGSSATWLFTSIAEDGDTLFGLCDLGHGSPELGYASLSEIASVRFPPFNLGVERDRYFTANKTLEEYANEARREGRIVA